MLTRKKDDEKKQQSISMCHSCELERDCVMSHGGGNLYACDEYQQVEMKKEKPNYQEEMKNVEKLGLCATCQEKKECRQKSLPGGVWHCEEYQ
ncbi:hypothetical protein SAMN05192551_10289 [Tindallia magadiensis]|uniref:Uncharacterized protein n=1 Tax=Tindallia magadiensis TaxID=69895 RepID=A0A1I3BXG3_9FIRM|nr:hypothetical protein [Tindallia magadiensis]SFH67005.1 hypothetical protein SAMN05192551_10289 [Tindallia magadiensis]